MITRVVFALDHDDGRVGAERCGCRCASHPRANYSYVRANQIRHGRFPR
jgi:hypothetical protein